jgi:hypothetical protein
VFIASLSLLSNALNHLSCSAISSELRPASWPLIWTEPAGDYRPVSRYTLNLTISGRNTITHEGQIATENDAKLAIKVARKILKIAASS